MLVLVLLLPLVVVLQLPLPLLVLFYKLIYVRSVAFNEHSSLSVCLSVCIFICRSLLMPAVSIIQRFEPVDVAATATNANLTYEY